MFHVELWLHLEGGIIKNNSRVVYFETVFFAVLHNDIRVAGAYKTRNCGHFIDFQLPQ
jgi:hypothetical protein